MLTVFFTKGPVTSLQEAKESDLMRFQKFFQGMLEEGVYLPCSQFEAWFVSTAHRQEDLEYTVAAADRVWSRAAGK
jgi:glutamate-1-semialdehyde 2,1-aminomutase